MLFIGEKVGCGGPAMDIAVDPLEGTEIAAKGAPNALAVVALAEHGNFLHAPDVYMDKIAVGPACRKESSPSRRQWRRTCATSPRRSAARLRT